MHFLSLSSSYFTRGLSYTFRISTSVGRSKGKISSGYIRTIAQVKNMGSSTTKDNETLFLFDVDGTLTPARQIINPQFYEFLTKDVATKVKIGIVGGSDLEKILEQLNVGDQALTDFDYVFSENGLLAHGDGKLIGQQSILKFIGEEKLQEFINFSLGYLAKLKLPCKRGNFIEFRNGMINVCPVGRSCSLEERAQFVEYDKVHKVRETMIAELQKEFPNIGMQFSIGGQISIDAFPRGWDKTQALTYLGHIPRIHFFGDKTKPGENDYEIFADERTIGHTVLNPEDTEKQIREILGAL